MLEAGGQGRQKSRSSVTGTDHRGGFQLKKNQEDLVKINQAEPSFQQEIRTYSLNKILL
jgi:hypothetical protein